MRRLYVGGLSHTVTQKDLKDRFGKFGDVDDVELRTRKDEEGVPYKTFGYININISDADLKKCLTVLNKSRWKGGTLQIEMAKESFLHRLAQERQTAVEQHLQPPATENKRQQLLESLSKAGVDHFTMKAAVPGTEVPGHKDWVVSKFGRVLPVLQLRCRKGSKARTVKYDPSKYSHNIRRLDRVTEDQSTPITQLTWEVEGGDDDVSKRRRGEFPHYELPRPKKSRPASFGSHNAVSRTRLEQTVSTRDQQLTNGSRLLTHHRPAQRTGTRHTDSDIDSDEEIRRLVVAQQTSHGALQQHEEEEDDNLEVVGLDYLLESAQKADKDEDAYDSADTDELFSSRKNPLPHPQKKLSSATVEQLSERTDEKRKTKKKRKAEEEEVVKVTSEKPSSIQQQEDSSKDQRSKKMTVVPVLKPSSASDGDEEEMESDGDEEEMESDGDEEEMESDGDEEEMESAGSCSDSDYEAMFSNVTHLEISLGDLQKLAEDAQQVAETTAPSIPGAASSSAEQHVPKKGTTPEEILASILQDDSSDDEAKTKKKRKRKGVASAPLPTFQGTKSLLEATKTDERQRRQEGEEEEEKEEVAAGQKANRTDFTDTSATKAPPSSCSSSEEDEQEAASQSPQQPKSSSSEEDEEDELAPPRQVLRAEEEEELQRKANLRRLAALQQRQKEAEEHKRFIQGALANLDTPAPGAGKHIVFGSDDEDEDDQQVVAEQKKSPLHDSQSEDEVTADQAPANQSATKKEKKKQTPKQLFDGSEDEEDADEEEGGSRFSIRPQFEGQAGQKLMAMQSRFGADERFRMDSRFMEEEEEEEEEEDTEAKRNLTAEEEALEEERRKNLSIMQSILGGSQQTSSRATAGKAKKFRDVAALHYDPSKEEHAAFETKTDESKKESKSARRKKREEAQKLPEVSKEIYYNVSGDLKAVFGQTKDDVAEGEENWDQVEEEEGEAKEEELMASLLSAELSTKKEESPGFTFSFFGVEAEAESRETTAYKVENIQAPKVSWQQDPRFQDSSSEEEEEEQVEEDEEQSSSTTRTTEEKNPSKTDLFFFYPDDSRLTEGPRSFCRTGGLEEQREQWEERRSALRQEYRKKHKDARRKMRASVKK